MLTLNASRSPTGAAKWGALFYLVHWGAVGAFLPFLNVYFVRLGLSGRQIGLLAALFPLLTLLLAPTLSALADRWGRRTGMLQLSLAGVVISFFFLGRPDTFAGLIPWMILLALFRSPVLSLADGLIARLAAEQEVDFGRLRLWGSFGFATVAILSGLLWAQVGYRPLFVVTGLLFAPAIWLAGRLEGGGRAAHQAPTPLKVLAGDAGLLVLLATSWLVGLTLGIAIIFEGIYMHYLGGGGGMIGLFLGLIGFSELPGMRYSGPLIRRWGGLKTLLLAYTLFGGSFLGYAISDTPYLLLAFGVIRGAGFGLFLAGTVRLIDARAPAGWTATVQSLREAGMFGLAPLLAAPLAGEVYDRWGPEPVFIIAAAASGLAVLGLLAAAWKRWV